MAPTAKVYRFLTANQVLRLYQNNISRTISAPQKTMLESAVDSPMNHKRLGGQDNVYQLGGVLAEKLILNHSFQDGNKRLATISVDMFFKMNGLKLQDNPLKGANDAKIAQAHVKVATKEWDAAELGRFYQTIATPVGNADKPLATLIAEFAKGAESH